MAAGLAWSLVLPINRHIWTSSLVLWMGGASFLVLALFYAIIDVAGAKRWAFFFIVIGTNALLAYVVSESLRPYTERRVGNWPCQAVAAAVR